MFSINSKLLYTPTLLTIGVTFFNVMTDKISLMEIPGFILLYISLPFFIIVWILVLFKGSFKWVDKFFNYFDPIKD